MRTHCFQKKFVFKPCRPHPPDIGTYPASTAGNTRADVRHILRGPRLQAKLTIGPPDDIYEQEADRVADEVMRMPEPRQQTAPACSIGACSQVEEGTIQLKPLSDQITPLVQRQVEDEEEELIQSKALGGFNEAALQRQPEEEEEELLQTKPASGHTPEVTPSVVSAITAMQGGGQPLPASERTFFEPRFGYDFSQVRIHSDARAADSARSVNALAYTVGRDVVFGAGQYTTPTMARNRLLAHELAHVLQQTKNSRLGLQRAKVKAAGCAVNGIAPKDAGDAAQRQIKLHLENNVGLDMGDEAEIPRAAKVGKGGSVLEDPCPLEKTALGKADFYKFEKPVFRLAEVKPMTSHGLALREYRHYKLRLEELESRFFKKGRCPDEEAKDEDRRFDEKYLANYLIEALGHSFSDDLEHKSEFRVEPLGGFEGEWDAGIFHTVNDVPLDSTLHLYYENMQDGTILYQCREEHEKDEGEPDQEERPAPGEPAPATDCPPRVPGGEAGEVKGGMCRYKIPGDMPAEACKPDPPCRPSGVPVNGQYPECSCSVSK